MASELSDSTGDLSAQSGDLLAEYRAACKRCAFFDLSDRGKIELAGAEAPAFLHNLCTNDIRGLAPGAGCEAFLATTKGRLIAPLDISRLRGDGRPALLCDTAAGLGEKVCQHLTRYRISEDVDITDRTRELALFHMCGPEAAHVAAHCVGATLVDLSPWQQLEKATAGGTQVLRRHDLLNLPGFDLLCPATEARRLWDDLVQAGAVPAGPQTFETLRIEAGLPRFGVDMDDDRLVMEIGRTRQAISFQKGCYLGQESIVMARDRGHVNRQLLGLIISDKGPVPAGSRVLQGEEEVGQVTSSVNSSRLGKAIALAYLKRGCQTPGTTVTIATDTGAVSAIVAELPFLPPLSPAGERGRG